MEPKNKRITIQLVTEVDPPSTGETLEELEQYKHHATVVIGSMYKTGNGDELSVFRIDKSVIDTPEAFAKMIRKFGEYVTERLLEQVKLPADTGETNDG